MKSKSIPIRITGLFLGAAFVGFAIIIGLSDDDISLLSIISMLVVGFYFAIKGVGDKCKSLSFVTKSNGLESIEKINLPKSM